MGTVKGTKTEQITLRLSFEERQALDGMVAEDGTLNYSEWVRDTIRSQAADRGMMPAPAAEQLSAEELETARKMGLEPTEYLRGKLRGPRG